MKAFVVKNIERRLLILDALILGVGFLMIYMFPFSFGVRDLNEIRAKKELRVAINMNQIDYMFRGDSLAGFQYELVKYLCDSALHVKPKFIRVQSFQAAIQELLDGKVDLIAQNIPLTSETKKSILISYPILVSRAVLVQHKNSKGNDLITNQLDLKEKQISVPLNSYYIQLIRHLAHEVSDTIYINQMRVYDPEELILLVAKGSIPYTIADERVARYFSKRFTNIDVSLPMGFSQLQGWGLNPQTPKLDSLINHWLPIFEKSTAFHQLYNKYYH
jgi:ABC-type amino acid transport substrate-binding protein